MRVCISPSGVHWLIQLVKNVLENVHNTKKIQKLTQRKGMVEDVYRAQNIYENIQNVETGLKMCIIQKKIHTRKINVVEGTHNVKIIG